MHGWPVKSTDSTTPSLLFFSLPVEVIQTKNASCSSLPDRVVYVSCRIRVNLECNSSTQSCFFVQVRGRICRVCHYAKSAKDDGAHVLFLTPLEPCILVAILVLFSAVIRGMHASCWCFLLRTCTWGSGNFYARKWLMRGASLQQASAWQETP